MGKRGIIDGSSFIWGNWFIRDGFLGGEFKFMGVKKLWDSSGELSLTVVKIID